MPAKLTYNKVKQFFKDNKCKLLTQVYLSNKQKLEYIASCGHKRTSCLSHIKSSKQFKCKNCKLNEPKIKLTIKKMNREFARCLKYRDDFNPENYGKKLTCWDCNKSKPRHLFPYRKQYKDNKEKRCKKCNRENHKFRRNNHTKEQIINELLNSCKASCKSRTKNKRFNASVFNITVNDILELAKKQDNKCVYTGKELSWKANDNYKISIDRINSSKGYVKNNIQLVGWIVNQAKSNLSEKNFLNMIKNIYNNKIQK